MSDQLPAVYQVDDLDLIANKVCRSGLFPGIRTPDAAFSLMLLCQSEGLHPMQALRRFHIIEGRPSMRADAMLAEFQRQGGRVEWHERTDDSVSATFSHPAGGSARISWTAADAKRAGLWGKGNWTKYPRQMLTARVISEGIRTVLPGVVVGVYTPEEVQDFEPSPVEARVVEPRPAGNGNGNGGGKRLTFSDMMGRAIERWDGFDPLPTDPADRDKKRTAREHRIAHHVVTALVDLGELDQSEILQANGKRSPAKTWKAFKAAFDSDGDLQAETDGPPVKVRRWVLEEVARYLRAKQAEQMGIEATDDDPDPPDDGATPWEGEVLDGDGDMTDAEARAVLGPGADG